MDQKKYELRNTKFIQYNVDIPPQHSDWWDMVIGIDPGNKNMGLTILSNHIVFVQCYEVTFPSERMVISRLIQIRLALSDIMCSIQQSRFHYKMLVVTEGSSYGSRYRNTELAEARIVAVEWFLDNFDLSAKDFRIIPPQSVRKIVFGSAKIRAEDEWPSLAGDAASSLAVAIAGLRITNE